MEFVTWVESRDVCRHQHINNCFRCIQHPDITGVSARLLPMSPPGRKWVPSARNGPLGLRPDSPSRASTIKRKLGAPPATVACHNARQTMS